MATDEFSHEYTERARKNLTTILQSLSSAGQAKVGRTIGVSEATISRMKSEGELNQLAALLSACGLKVVPTHYRMAKPEVIGAYQAIVQAALNQEDASRLVWDDGE